MSRSSSIHSRLFFGFIFLLITVSSSATSLAPDVAATTTGTTATTTTPTTENTTARTSTPAYYQTCESRAINYITHGLPKQCLEPKWRTHTSAATHPSSISNPHPTSSTAFVTAKDAEASAGEQANESTPHNPSSKDDFDHASTINPSSPSTSLATPSSTSDDSSSSQSPSPHSSLVIPDNPDQQIEDSPLDNAKFLSFEEWKKANLAQAGQSAETLGQGRASTGSTQPRQRPAGNNNGLDSLGEDSEIELDFSGFGPSTDSEHHGPDGRPTQQSGEKPSAAAAAVQPVAAAPYLRSKDAGVTCKERFNYASFDCAANVLKTNPKCKNPSSILVENKDSYMLNECSVENKFLIVELCDDILIDTIVLANFEFFSSMFRSFRVSVSDRYPVKAEKWKELGTFEARNTRGIQAFLVENPLIWTRYLRVEFLAHYGSEFYCPLSLLRVHGTTMMEEFRNQEALARGDIDPEDEETSVVAIGLGDEHVEKVVSSDAQPTDLSEKVQASDDAHPPRSEAKIESSLSAQSDSASPEVPQNHSEPPPSATTPSSSSSSSNVAYSNSSDALQVCPVHGSDAIIRNLANITARSHDHYTCAMHESPTPHASHYNTLTNSNRDSTAPKSSQAEKSTAAPPPVSNNGTRTLAPSPEHPQPIPGIALNGTVSPQQDLSSDSDSFSLGSSSRVGADDGLSGPLKPSTSLPPLFISSSSQPPSVATSVVLVATAISQASSVPHSSTVSPSQPAASPPATQESFFKSISKRLQILESNATLSLQYIEAQSQLLRDAFGKVEKRQLNKTSQFLETLNRTVLSELSRFKGEYEQLWQSTVLELASQRDEGRRERELLGERVRMLAEEMISQKRLMAAQATLLLLCLGLVVFGKFGGPSNSSSDIGFVAGMQDIIRRSRSTRRRNVFNREDMGGSSGSKAAGVEGGSWQWDNRDNSNNSPWTSPVQSPSITRPSTAHGRSLSRETSDVTKALRGLDIDGHQEAADEEIEEDVLTSMKKQQHDFPHRRNMSHASILEDGGNTLQAPLVPLPPARANSSPSSLLSPPSPLGTHIHTLHPHYHHHHDIDGSNNHSNNYGGMVNGGQHEKPPPESSSSLSPSSPRQSPKRKRSSQSGRKKKATASPSPLALTSTSISMSKPSSVRASSAGPGTPFSGGSLDGFDS